jgi:two-component system, chemotaxis family, chemotaxis protein CheY
MDKLLKKHDTQEPIVLIVDDNPSIRNIVAWSLKFGGFEPAEAANGLEAVSWIEQASQAQRYPAVILLDLAMPGMNGEHFLQWLQSTWPGHYPSPAIIIITAGYTDQSKLNSYVKQVVLKPFHVRELLEVIKKWAA